MLDPERAAFANPEADFRLAPFWFLNHHLSADELRRQVREMHTNGVGGFILHARSGLINAYMTDEWMDLCAAAIDEAATLGMKVYLYDDFHFVSGTAGGRVTEEPSFRQRCLVLTPDGEIVTREFHEGFNYWGVPDYMNPDATDRFLELTHEAYRRRFGHLFGNVIVGVFTDEPGLNYMQHHGPAVPWTATLPEEFHRDHGYDLTPHLLSLFRDTERAAQVRGDFWATVSRLYADNFFRRVYEYCDACGLKFVGHVSSEGELHMQAARQADFFRLSRWMHFGGTDQLFSLTWPAPEVNNLLAPKMAASAARLYDKARTMSEAFGLADGWAVSLRTLKRLADWQIALGVNLLMPHAFYYSIQGFRKWESAPGQFYQSPFWHYYRVFADYVARLCQVFSGGDRLPDIAVVYALRNLWETNLSGAEPDAEGERIIAAMTDVTTELVRRHYDFDIVPEDALDEVASRYKRLLIPPDMDLAGIEPQARITQDGENIGDILCLKYRKAGADFYFLANSSADRAYSAHIELSSTGTPSLWDAVTGEIASLGALPLDLSFEPTQSYLICVSQDAPAAPARAKVEPRLLLTLPEEWSFSTEKPNSLPLTDWRLQLQGFGEVDRTEGHRTYESSLLLDAPVPGARLLLDGMIGELCWHYYPMHFTVAVELNGAAVTGFEPGAYLDCMMHEAPVGHLLTPGHNRLVLQTRAEPYEGGNLGHPPMLLGDFRLRRDGDGWAVAPPSRTRVSGSWTDFGYPFYSGVATYSQEVTLPAPSGGERLTVRFEAVGDLAELRVNGATAGVAAWEPFEVDITPHVAAGPNTIEIRIANSLHNLLVLSPKPSGLLGRVDVLVR